MVGVGREPERRTQASTTEPRSTSRHASGDRIVSHEPALLIAGAVVKAATLLLVVVTLWRITARFGDPAAVIDRGGKKWIILCLVCLGASIVLANLARLT